MPYKSNEDVKSKVKGASKYSDSQLTAFRKAFNSSLSSCLKKGGDASDCESSAYAIGHSAAKKAKHEEIMTRVKLEGNVTSIKVIMYEGTETFEGTDLWYYIDDDKWKMYICDGSRTVGIFNTWSGIILNPK